jgi:hypothetical protein
MAHFAKLGLDSKIIAVIYVNNEVLKDTNGVEKEVNGIEFLTKLYNYPFWKQTSYNTHGGVHDNGGTPFRKNYAGIGYTYDETRDAFIAPKPFNSWVLNESTCRWESPIPLPIDASIDKGYQWNEQIQNWELING